MTVKDKVGRVRYVAFRLHGGPLPRGPVAGALPPFAKLTRFDGEWGILRTGHRDRDELLRVLKDPRQLAGREVRFETLATSGTIRAAARALPATSTASRKARRD